MISSAAGKEWKKSGLTYQNVFVKRKSSAWTDQEEHQVIIKIIGRVLEPYLEQYQAILIFDALKAHLVADVLEELFI